MTTKEKLRAIDLQQKALEKLESQLFEMENLLNNNKKLNLSCYDSILHELKTRFNLKQIISDGITANISLLKEQIEAQISEIESFLK